MKKLSITFSLLVFLCAFVDTSTFAEIASSKEKVIISFENEIDYEELEKMGAEIHSELDAISSVIATLPEAVIMKANIEMDASIKSISEDKIFKAAGQQPTWGYQHIKAPNALKLGYTGKGVKIAVMDTGINASHPDLRVAGGISMIGDSSPLTDGNGHGTHVAGVIGALNNSIGVVGAAPDAEIYSVKVLGSDGAGKLEYVLNGIQWAIDHEMDIINLSLTTENNIPELQELLKKAYQQGILIVGAAGNIETLTQEQEDTLYPARYSSVIAVGSINSDNALSHFSYQGPSVELVAPGQGVNSTYSNATTSTEEDYKVSQGTSVSTPFVAAVFAQYMEAYPHLSNTQLRETVKRSLIDLGVKGKDNSFGYGLVQSIQTQAALFPDLKTNFWYTDSIQYIFDRSVINGFPDGTFRPASSITRADAITMIGRAIGIQPDSSNHYFPDVSQTSYSAGYINKAYEHGYITGMPDGSFQPNAPIKRGDMAVIIERIFAFTSSGGSSFSDVNEFKYYAEAIQAAFENGIVQGYDRNTFRPEATITRAENAEILSKSLKFQQ